MPWKLLLKMGKIKPSPEAIDRFMSMGDKTKEIIKQKLLDIVVGDLYWSVITPSQALLMLYGIPPPNVYETVKEMKRIFVDKEKILEKKYVDILENIAITYYKGFEHGKVKEVTGTEIDKLMKDADEYMKRLKELHLEIDKRAQERTLKDTYENTFKLLKHLFGNKSEGELVKLFEKEIVNKGKSEPKDLHVLNEIIDAKKKYQSKKKPTKYEIEDVRKNATHLTNHLIEYGQRCELSDLRKMQIRVNYGADKHFELFLTNPLFILVDNQIKRLNDSGKIELSSQEEFESILMTQKGKPNKLTIEALNALKKEFGNFDLNF
jgi:uncharacterized protein (UPF0332 family)